MRQLHRIKGRRKQGSRTMIPNWKRRQFRIEEALKSMDGAREKPVEREVKPMAKVGNLHFPKILKGAK